MRRIIFIVLALLFSGGILVISAVKEAQPGMLLAVAEEESQPVEPEEPTTVVKQEVDYYLPYPGILPDHPLYFIKMVRDRILLMVTGEPLAKAERLLLYADKRLGAAKALAEGNKPTLAVTTLTKAEKYLEQAVTEAVKAKEAGKDTGELMERLWRATAKHREVIEGLMAKIPPDSAAVVGGAQELVVKEHMEVSETLNKRDYWEEMREEAVNEASEAAQED